MPRRGTGRRRTGIAACAATLYPLLLAGPACADPAVPAPFVSLLAVDATIRQDIRYAGDRNVTGRPLAGYEAPLCLLAAPAAVALSRAQALLAARGLSLMALDCYRPQRASDDLMRWASVEPDARSPWHPSIRRGQLFERGYIARRSGHSRGYSVDVTIVRADGDRKPSRAPVGTATCRDEPIGGLPTSELDFGTTFDCFDPSSATGSPSVSGTARANRALLETTMRQAGFRNYRREWWHFGLADVPADAPYHDFTIRDR